MKKYINKLSIYSFILSITTLGVLTIIENTNIGAVSNYFDIHIVSAIIALTGIASILTSSTKNETAPTKK